MQLFLTPYGQNNALISITEPRVIEQLTRVLRAKMGDRIMVQLPVCVMSCKEGDLIQRHVCAITLLAKSHIEATVVETEEYVYVPQVSTLAVAMTNRFEKIELIVQKATEMGLHHMMFFPAARSQIREVSENKKERVQKIILEAVEQSYGRVLPDICYVSDLQCLDAAALLYVLHQDGTEKISDVVCGGDEKKRKIFFVGPEGGRASDDEKIFTALHTQHVALGKSILRTETAAIVVAWELVK